MGVTVVLPFVIRFVFFSNKGRFLAKVVHGKALP